MHRSFLVLVASATILLGWLGGVLIFTTKTSLGPIECGFGEPAIGVYLRRDSGASSSVMASIPIRCDKPTPYDFDFAKEPNSFSLHERFVCPQMVERRAYWTFGLSRLIGLSDESANTFAEGCRKI